MNQFELLLWPAPLITESTRGYMLRAAEMNLFPRMFSEDLQSIEGSMRFFAQAQEKNHAVAAHLRTRFTQADIGKRSAMRMVRLGGDTIPEKLLMATNRRVCPACLAERSHNSLEWELSSVQACTLHSSRLIKYCPSCEKPIQWYRSGLFNCICGQDLRAITPQKAMSWQITWAKLVKKAVDVSLTPPPEPSNRFGFVSHQRIGLKPFKRRDLQYTPIRLSKLLLMADVVRFALLPGQIDRHLASQHEMLTCRILANPAYRAYLWNGIFLFAAANPFRLARMLTPGQTPEYIFESYKDLVPQLAFSDVLKELTLTKGVSKPAKNAVFFDVRRHGVPPHAYLTGGWDEDDWADEDDLNQELLQEAHT
jgi:hypothetical protein